MSNIYDPIAGIYITRMIRRPIIAGTKRKKSFEDEQVKKLKREKEIEIIAKIENGLSLFEKFDMSEDLRLKVAIFRNKVDSFKIHRAQ